MKINVIGTPYSGAESYAIQLAEDLGMPFFNEPFRFEDTVTKIYEGPLEAGGGIPTNYEDYVAHHTAEQYLRAGSFTKDHKLIFIDRRTKWLQMIIYLSATALYEEYNRKYNIEHTANTVDITEEQIKKYDDEINAFNFLFNKFGNGKLIHYEDIKSRNENIRHPSGHTNLKFKNRNTMKKYYFDVIRAKEKKTVFFIVQSEMTWNGFRSLYYELKKSPDYEPQVVVIPQVYDTSIVQEKTWDWTTDHSTKMLSEENVPFFNLATLETEEQRMTYLKKMNPEYSFISTKDDWYIKTFFGLSCKEISKHLKLVYIPYYGATTVDVEEVHTQGKGHLSYWKILVDSTLYADLFIKEDINNINRLINVGHPKIEEIYKIRNYEGRWPLPDSEGKLKVIWAPHWSCPEFPNWDYLGTRPNRMKLGTFWQNCHDFYEYAKENQDRVQFVFRPHPLLQVHCKLHGYYEKFSEFFDQWSMLPNVYNEMSGLYNDSFAASDVMITEGISFLTEYPIATGKPLILIQNEQGCKFNELGVMAQDYANKVTSFNEIRYLLDFPSALKTGDVTPMLDYLIPYREDTSKKIISNIERMLFDDL